MNQKKLWLLTLCCLVISATLFTALVEAAPPTPTPRRIQVTPTPQGQQATPTPTRRTIATPAPTQRSGIYVGYVIQADWGSGAMIGITITNNTPETIPVGWQLVWTVPTGVIISPIYGGPVTIVQVGNQVTATGNIPIPANGGSINFGFNMTYTGINVKPTAFTLNGIPCIIR